MIYIITEFDGASLAFWEAVNLNLLDNGAKTLASNGLHNMINVVNRLGLKAGDTLLLAIDKANSNRTVTREAVLEATFQLCKSKRARLLATTYYCFEEIFLSYKYLVPLMNKPSTDYKVMLAEVVQHYIRMDTDYSLVKNGVLGDFLSKRPELCTREQAAKEILRYLSITIVGLFETIPKRIGICWIGDCNKLRIENYKYLTPVCCSKCNYECKMTTATDKLKHLDENTLFNQSGKLSLQGLRDYI